MNNKRALYFAAGIILGAVAYLGYTAHSLTTDIEKQLLSEIDARETWDGEAYQVLQEVAAQCRPEWKKPRLFVSEWDIDGSPAASIRGSTTPLRLRGGIIVIQKDFFSSYPRETIAAAYAHELGHLAKDHPLIPAILLSHDYSVEAYEQRESDADIQAVRCLGPDAMVAMYRDLVRTIEMVTPDNLYVRNEFDRRIEYIKTHSQK